MGCLCSKGSSSSKHARSNHKNKDSNKSSPLPSPSKKNEDIPLTVNGGSDESIIKSKPSLRVQSSRHSDFLIDGISKQRDDRHGEKSKTIIVERPSSHSSHHQKKVIENEGINNGGQNYMNKIISMPHSAQGEQVTAGWPSWLSSVAGEAIQGWLPRTADSFEKLNKVS